MNLRRKVRRVLMPGLDFERHTGLNVPAKEDPEGLGAWIRL